MNKEFVEEIVETICNRIEIMVKSILQTHLENSTKKQNAIIDKAFKHSEGVF